MFRVRPASREVTRRARFDLREPVEKYVPLMTVISTAGLLAFYRYGKVSAQASMWWDSASFLTNGAIYGGYYQNGYDLTRPPFIPVALAVLFHLTGGPSLQSGLAISDFLYFSATLGGYLIARKAMNSWLAVLLAISFATVLNVSNWSGIILTNVEGVALEALGLGLLITAREGQPRLYVLAIPFLVLAPLTRYSAGIIVPVAFVYLALSRKSDFHPSEGAHVKFVVAGVLVSAILAGMVSFNWLYPVAVGGQPFSALFPRGLPRSSLFQTGYFTNLPGELGNGAYGVVLVALLLFGTGLFTVLQYKRHRISPTVGAVVFWFLASLFYYSFIWTDFKVEDQLRYSTEFAMPALIIGFWSLDYVLKRPVKLKSIATLIIISGLFIPFFSSAYTGVVNTRDKGVGSSTNFGIQEAAAWIKANVPSNITLSSNWPTIVQWYIPRHNVRYLGERSDITANNASFNRWVSQLQRSHIGYVVWVTPFPNFKNPHLSVVWRVSSVEIFKVRN